MGGKKGKRLGGEGVGGGLGRTSVARWREGECEGHGEGAVMYSLVGWAAGSGPPSLALSVHV